MERIKAGTYRDSGCASPSAQGRSRRRCRLNSSPGRRTAVRGKRGMSGASVTPGRALHKALEGQSSRGRLASPRRLLFDTSSTRAQDKYTARRARLPPRPSAGIDSACAMPGQWLPPSIQPAETIRHFLIPNAPPINTESERGRRSARGSRRRRPRSHSIQNAVIGVALLAEFIVIIGHPLFGWGPKPKAYAATPQPLTYNVPAPPSGRDALLTLGAAAERRPVGPPTARTPYAYVRNGISPPASPGRLCRHAFSRPLRNHGAGPTVPVVFSGSRERPRAQPSMT